MKTINFTDRSYQQLSTSYTNLSNRYRTVKVRFNRSKNTITGFFIVKP